MKQKTEQHYRWKITLRVMLAITGGYVLTNLASILISFLLPLSKSDAVMTALLLSFIIYTCVVIWVFSVKSLRTVFLGLTSTSLAIGVTALILYFSGVAQ
ncbi:MAG: DUF3649 domain-containing protein [Marinagarivorans sp.]|nr:DUF3649 domain-containing protein [Marinagarivorans sp.]